MVIRPPISVIIISFFKIHRLKVCINSILPLIDFDVDELCIVDNSFASWDEKSVQRNEIIGYLTELANQLPIHFIKNSDNRKFSHSVNQGIEATKNRFIFLVNNDIEVTDPFTFINLTGEFNNHSSIATITPVTIHSNGSVYCSGACGAGSHLRDEPKGIRETEWNNFSFVCIDREAIKKVGLLATGQVTLRGRMIGCRHYHSDEEWCRRATSAGYIHLVHPIKVIHYHKEDKHDCIG